MSDKRVVALSGINANENPGPGVPIARSLKEGNPQLSLQGLSYDVYDSGHYMEFLFQDTFRLPYPTKGWGPIFKELRSIREKTGLEAIIPSLDVELPLYIRYQQDLLKEGIRTFLPTEEQFEIRCKERLPEISKRLRFAHPKTVRVSSVEELLEVLKEEIPPPCMIKGNHYKAYLVHNADQAVLKFTEISSEWGLPILVQEVVSGKEINLVGLGDGLGTSCGMVAVKKLTTTQLGKIWTGVTISHAELLEHGKQFIKETRWRGPFELECIESEDKIYLIEVNPRFPAWVYFATAAGINLPVRLLKLIFEGDCERSQEYETGRLFVRYTYEIVTDLKKYSLLTLQK